MRNYTIHFLDDKEFEALPYKDTDSSLGLADSHTKEAYVRRTGIAPIDMFTAMHELEHLEEGREGVHAHHEKYGDGVYYKGFGETLGYAAPALAFVPGVGPLLSMGAGLAGGLISSRDQARQQRQMMPGYAPSQYSWNPNVMTPANSAPNISTPLSFGLGAEEKKDQSKQQSLFDLINQKGQYSGK